MYKYLASIVLCTFLISLIGCQQAEEDRDYEIIQGEIINVDEDSFIMVGNTFKFNVDYASIDGSYEKGEIVRVYIKEQLFTDHYDIKDVKALKIEKVEE